MHTGGEFCFTGCLYSHRTCNIFVVERPYCMKVVVLSSDFRYFTAALFSIIFTLFLLNFHIFCDILLRSIILQDFFWDFLDTNIAFAAACFIYKVHVLAYCSISSWWKKYTQTAFPNSHIFHVLYVHFLVLYFSISLSLLLLVEKVDGDWGWRVGMLEELQMGQSEYWKSIMRRVLLYFIIQIKLEVIIWEFRFCLLEGRLRILSFLWDQK